MSIELTFKQQLTIYHQLKNKFENISYNAFFYEYKEEGLELREIPLAIAFNKTFGCGLQKARELANEYLS